MTWSAAFPFLPHLRGAAAGQTHARLPLQSPAGRLGTSHCGAPWRQASSGAEKEGTKENRGVPGARRVRAMDAGPSTGNGAGARPGGGARKLVIKAFKGARLMVSSVAHASCTHPTPRAVPHPIRTSPCLSPCPACTEKPKLPDDFEAVTWGKLRTALSAIAAKVPVAFSFEELYRVRSPTLCSLLRRASRCAA